MKKHIFVALACFLVGTVLMNLEMKKDINMVSIHTDQSYIVNELQDLEVNSDVIIKARVLPDSVNETFETQGGLTYYGITYTSLEVTNVFSGNVNIGDKLMITEEYYYVDELTVRNIFHTENYGPSSAGQEYIFFLQKYPDNKSEFTGMYFPLGVEKGRYPILKKQGSFSRGQSIITIDNFSNEELNLGAEDSKKYREIFEDVMQKYY